MSLNNTPSSDRVHIGIFGKRNAGKSSVINALTGQNLAIVSDVLGTTTDPVSKAMELLPLGPVVIIDTPGIDDSGELGTLRIQKSYQVLNKTDIAVLVVDGTQGISSEDRALFEHIQKKQIPCVTVFNKADLVQNRDSVQQNSVWVSTATGENIHALKELIAAQLPQKDFVRQIVGQLLSPGDFAVLVIPIDSAAPKGRLILPQQQVIRDLLESDCTAIAVKEDRLKETLAGLSQKPKIVITDSQAFGRVSADTPTDIYLTSFSILFANYKGDLSGAVKGAAAVDELKNGDTVLISEGCTHHRQCGDIGTVKLPAWISAYTKKNLRFAFTGGTEFPTDLTPYQLIVHCGGCMLNEREMKYRLGCAADAGVPITNYGTMIAYLHGILKRSVQCFPQIAAMLE